MKKILLISCVLVLVPVTLCTFLYVKIEKTATQKLPNKDISHVIVLGAKVNGETMSLSLLNRAKTALKYVKERPKTMLVLTGGQGPGEDITEAEALRRYFVENGISEDRLLLESRSTSTFENVKYAKELFELEEAIIVSNDFHLYRSVQLAKKVGITAYPLAAETPTIVKTQLYVREYAAIVKMYLLGN